MVEMITMERVQAYIARGAPVSLLCQSKNSEVLNTFHPDGGGGAGSTIRKRVEKPLACQFLGLVMPRACVCVCVFSAAIVMPGGHKGIID